MYSSIPLDNDKREIRLLRVLPGEFNSQIRCDLFKSSLVKPPRYKALSYVWGDSSNRRKIVVNGNDVSVTANLELALRRLRAHADGTPLTLWVDALCINQNNLDERGEQVALMGSIYSSCSEVCIWLGPCDCEYNPTCLDSDGCGTGNVTGLTLCVRTLISFASGAHLGQVAPFAAGTQGSYQLMLDAMTELANSSWFCRAWIVQEAYLAPNATVYFGNAALSRELLWDAHINREKLAATCACCRGTPDIGPLLGAVGTFFVKLRRLVLRDPNGPQSSKGSLNGPNLALLEYTLSQRAQDCSDDRDRVYAYLGILEVLFDVELLKPDYHLTPSQLYFQVCADAVLKGHTLDFLAWNTSKNRCRGELPSWVIDWRNTTSTEETTQLLASKRWQGAHGLEFKAGIQDDRTLVAKGLQIDRVFRVGSLCQSILDPELWAQWHEVTRLHNEPDRLYPSGGTWRDAWWKALCFDSVNAEAKRSEQEICAFEFVSTVMPHSYLNFDLQVSKECQDMNFVVTEEAVIRMFQYTTAPIWGTLPHMLNNRRLFVTEKGYLGFSRDGLRVGDPIFLLPKCAAPLIMRHTGGQFCGDGNFDGESLKGSPIHELISDAYIYGIMDGEMVQEMGLYACEIVCVD